jgi:hypothetical protein
MPDHFSYDQVDFLIVKDIDNLQLSLIAQLNSTISLCIIGTKDFHRYGHTVATSAATFKYAYASHFISNSCSTSRLTEEEPLVILDDSQRAGSIRPVLFAC